MDNSIVVGKYRKGTVYEVSLPTLPSLSLQPRRVELIQEQYTHDILKLEFTNTSPAWFELVKTGVPIKFYWSQENKNKTWFGYVSFISKNVNTQIEDVMEVHCIGSTFPLKERLAKVFTNTSIPSAVKQIVTDMGFKYVGEEHPRIFEQLSVSGHSYWEWIQEQAKRIGYGVVVDGMVFCFRPLDKLINQGITSIPFLSIGNTSIQFNAQAVDRTLDWFKVLNGEYLEDASALRTVKGMSGIDPLTSELIYAEASPSSVGQALRETINDTIFYEPRSDQVIHDGNSAQNMADGAAALARFNMIAKAKCQGDPRIRPFYPVLIDGTGPLTDGYWIVKKVTHTFARIGDYQIEMTVQVDGTGVNNITAERQGTNTVVGMVNLSEVMGNGGANINSVDNNSAFLKITSPQFVVKEQGFKRTPARWLYGGN
jgi:phage protein D